MASRRKPTVLEPNAGGNAVIVGWQGLYHIFGARADGFEVTPEGVRVIGLKFPSQFNAETIISDLTNRNGRTVTRRLNLLPLFFWITGQEPEPFTSPIQMTNWMTQNLKGAGEDEGRSPKYAKDAINQFKIDNGMYVPRGRPRKVFSLEKIGELDASVLSDIDTSELEKLKETVDSLLVEA